MQLYSAQKTGSSAAHIRNELHAHTVQFYESDAFLSRVVADHIANGLGNGQPTVVIATLPHIQQVWGRLRLKGFELDLLEQSGQLQLLEAEGVMAKFMVRGRPDSERFNSVLHGIMRKGMNARPNRTIRAYGEMVDLLCKADNSAAALDLERMWNEAGKKYDFSLLCGYDMRSFAEGTVTSTYASVCGLHDHVYTPEA
jgi:hypothetical protein